jgi:hypothetical protein
VRPPRSRNGGDGTSGCADPESFSAPAAAIIGAATAGAREIDDNAPSTMAHETIFHGFIERLLFVAW